MQANIFIPQCKAYDSDKLTIANLTNLVDKDWYWSIKWDGQYCQIHYDGKNAIFYTSSGKPFKNDYFTPTLHHMLGPKPTILEAEYLGEGLGYLGHRANAAVTTTARTMYNKRQIYYAPHRLVIFDVIHGEKFGERLKYLDALRDMCPAQQGIKITRYEPITSYEHALEISREYIDQGFEGLVIKANNHLQYPGKRVKSALKIKSKSYADVTIKAINPGTGKYTGMIGSFRCVDKNGLVVDVGSGLDDNLRLSKENFIDKKIRISYERIDTTYIFPIFQAFI